MKKGTILSLEQATSLPYATQRFVQLGWRVIRVEATGVPGRAGDPNRYIGHDIGAGADRRAGFIAPNVGKEAIALNLKDAAGQQALQRLITALDVDVFCCNVLPKHHAALGVDYATLSAVKPSLIWASISAMGTAFPSVAGYDPIIQATSGLMSLNGDPTREPTLIGVPLTDLKAGDELYAAVLLGLLERTESGAGKRIDISMVQAAMSLLPTVLPLVDLGGAANVLTRSGNAHRQFVPTNVYRTRDGHLYLAIGSNAQWEKLLSIPGFETLQGPMFATLDARTENRLALYARIDAIVEQFTLDALIGHLERLSLPHSRINTVEQAMAHPAAASRLCWTEVAGKRVRLPPMASGGASPAVGADTAPVGSALPSARSNEAAGSAYPSAPHFGEHTRALLAESGLDTADIGALFADGVVQ
ncbi:CaiB/BaiF CoA-transferase family protein [Robbsia sp. KACC 23696]|uniref:CaiB/BaiF CoA transferase family protein n=1 Tax=Robbsia sp. KACC 23696 TaxID=3149231 RepID=UPI00325B3C6C